jgi:uncharacterized protein
MSSWHADRSAPDVPGQYCRRSVAHLYYDQDVFEIRWTEEAEAHIARHGVTLSEVEQATERPFWTYAGRDGTTVLLGATHNGRHLVIVLADALDGRCYVATARDMTPAERRVFKRKAH